ncbi:MULTISPECIES: winged helix-turn-helix domain-containing protein [Enterococcus]|uniref:OmpR/PhoB-type domain-containing protein n=1 Tax=Enterococcus alishanensis TaxID=1303817 RepID=A0ABS6TH08_9ENTE|nr:hypothetical protein [Enterococcus alishanensis]MBV7392094.1 hypothetical protein [Enterococcus alishanensis]
MNILLLSNCSFFETKFIQHLNAIKHEVFCSEQLLKILRTGGDVSGLLKYFQVVIFSETVSNQMIYEILSVCSFKQTIIILKTSHSLSENEKGLWLEKGITHFISEETNFDYLRELLWCDHYEDQLTLMNTNMEKSIRINEETMKEEEKRRFLRTLSNQEKLVFKELEEATGYVSREELSEKIWGKDCTSSTQSRLSNISKNINRKLKEFGIENMKILTSWGKGYSLELVN